MNWSAFGFIALGGAVGSVARAIVGAAIPAGRLPWATILINIVGSTVIGWLMARLTPVTPQNLSLYSFTVIGVCGGFTTFSTFSWQSFELMQKGNWLGAAANILLSVFLCLIATWLGWRLAR
jgi:CrcB protein